MMTDDDDDDLRALGKQLPADRPSADRRDAVRSQLIAAAAQPASPAPRRWMLVGAGFAAGALAAAAVAIVVVRPHAQVEAPVPAPYAQIESSSGAQLERVVSASPTGTDEVVRVHAGTVRVALPPTRAGDRVRIATSDAEIEGSGAYEVVAAAEHLAEVRVASGSAHVRVVGQAQVVVLGAGETWRAAVQTADLSPPAPDASPADASPVASPADDDGPALKTDVPGLSRGSASPAPSLPRSPTPTPTPTPTISPGAGKTTASGAPIETELEPASTVDAGVAPAPAPAPANAVEQHFRAGEELMRANKLAEAIVELGAAADAGDTPLAADARYYQAVALVKARRGAEAERALVQFLDRAPASVRRGRAAMMLGRLLADRGDREHARAWFEVAARDPDPAVAAAAAAELTASSR